MSCLPGPVPYDIVPRGEVNADSRHDVSACWRHDTSTRRPLEPGSPLQVCRLEVWNAHT